MFNGAWRPFDIITHIRWHHRCQLKHQPELKNRNKEAHDQMFLEFPQQHDDAHKVIELLGKNIKKTLALLTLCLLSSHDNAILSSRTEMMMGLVVYILNCKITHHVKFAFFSSCKG